MLQVWDHLGSGSPPPQEQGAGYPEGCASVDLVSPCSCRAPQCRHQPDTADGAQVWDGAWPDALGSAAGGGFSRDAPLPRHPAGCDGLLEVGKRTEEE